MFGFDVWTSVRVTSVMPEVLTENAEYLKFDEGHEFQRLDSPVSGKEITFQLTDGGLGDADGSANGVIVDPGFIGIPQAEAVPNVSGGSGSSGDSVSSGGGGGGGCSLSKEKGDLSDALLMLLPLLFVVLLKRGRCLHH